MVDLLTIAESKVPSEIGSMLHSTFKRVGLGIHYFSEEAPCCYSLLRRVLLNSVQLIFLVCWYEDFNLSTFLDRCEVLRFPIKLSFLGLLIEFKMSHVLSLFGAIFGTPV